MIEIQVDGFVVGYVEEWVYDLLYPALESLYQAEGHPDLLRAMDIAQRPHKLSESVIEAETGPSMADIDKWVDDQIASLVRSYLDGLLTKP